MAGSARGAPGLFVWLSRVGLFGFRRLGLFRRLRLLGLGLLRLGLLDLRRLRFGGLDRRGIGCLRCQGAEIRSGGGQRRTEVGTWDVQARGTPAKRGQDKTARSVFAEVWYLDLD